MPNQCTEFKIHDWVWAAGTGKVTGKSEQEGIKYRDGEKVVAIATK